MAAVRAVTVIRYPDRGPWTKEESLDPTWAQVEHHICEMHPFGHPIVFLQRQPGDTESDCMAINGGAGTYHVQGQRDGDWLQAVNAERGMEKVEVWTSDQGFVTQARFTWSLRDALRLARTYFENGMLDATFPGSDYFASVNRIDR